MESADYFEYKLLRAGHGIDELTRLQRPQSIKRQDGFYEADMQTLALSIQLLKANAQMQRETARRKQTEKQLHACRNKVSVLASDLQLSEERERQRLAQDLHDTVAQCLAGCRLKLEALQAHLPVGIDALQLDECIDFIDQAIKQTRLLMFECYPWIQSESGLEATLRSLAHRIQEVHGIQVECRGDGSTDALGRELSVSLFRTARELLINVVKHAHAKHATITIVTADNQIHIDVVDDGIGFNITDIAGKGAENCGFGLASIRERIGELGGRLDFSSSPEHGTTVSVVIPAE
jgi:signal transduction histidine kinase